MDSVFLVITLILSVTGFGSLQQSPCPAGCNCSVLSMSCCGSERYISIPLTGPNKTTKLNLTNCPKIDISKKSFQNMESLEEIIIVRTTVMYIDSATFIDFKELKKLSLNELNLSTSNIHPFVFNNLPVQHLDLRENNFMLVSRQMFSGLKNLRVLDLSRNKIGLIEMLAFDSLFQLSVLKLDYNNLTTVTPFWFKPYRNYSSLKISIDGNNITSECRFRGMDLLNNQWFANSLTPNNSLTFMYPSTPPCSMPTFNEPYQEISIKESTSIALTCFTNSIPKSEFSWVLPNGLAVTYVINGTLNITNVQSGNAGLYACVATNSEGRAVALTRLSVLSYNAANTAPSNTVARKSTIVLLIIFIVLILLCLCFLFVYVMKAVFKLSKRKDACGFEFRQFVDTPNILPVPENPQPMPQL